MIITEMQIDPIVVDDRSLRRGLLITLTNDRGELAQGEASPLPGYSRENLQQVSDQLNRYKTPILTRRWSIRNLDFLSSLSLFPSLDFALKSALLDLLQPPIQTQPKSYALLMGSSREILERGLDLAREVKFVKIKMGELSLREAHEIIEQLRERFEIRIDLNRRWSAAKTIELCRDYPEDFFTYIEEPAADPNDLVHFPYPFALDETLQTNNREGLFAHLLPRPQLRALIAKPTLIYPIDHLLSLGKEVVLTSSFEGEVGIHQIGKLAIRLGLQDTLHGLDTLCYTQVYNQ